ncbi:MAG TPA: metallophosphoesterase family protein [Burkholderiales bacterium]|nr:metallophosphoesterase family protein [Burkholderiales bacterium]
MYESVRRVGVISDTHGLLRTQALAALDGAQLIVHAGDIGQPAILEALARIAPVVAVRGNNDVGPWADRLPPTLRFSLGCASVYLTHDVKTIGSDLPGLGADVVVSGHSHRPRVQLDNGVLFVNPGSAGPRRFRLPVCVAWLECERGQLRARIVELDVQ